MSNKAGSRIFDIAIQVDEKIGIYIDISEYRILKCTPTETTMGIKVYTTAKIKGNGCHTLESQKHDSSKVKITNSDTITDLYSRLATNVNNFIQSNDYYSDEDKRTVKEAYKKINNDKAIIVKYFNNLK